MKIDKKRYLAFNISEDTWDTIVDNYERQIEHELKEGSVLSEEMSLNDAKAYRRKMMTAYRDNTGDWFYISKNAQDVIDRIKMKKFDLTQLSKIKRDTCTILLDDRSFYRYFVKGYEIFTLYMTYDPDIQYYSWVTFRINTKTGDHNDGTNKEVFEHWLRIMCYIELGSPELVVVKEGSSIGTRKTGKILNKSGFDVTLVRSNWNKIYVKDGFHVSGHWRWQRYGPQGQDMKLIFIEEFMKEGYTRTVKP